MLKWNLLKLKALPKVVSEKPLPKVISEKALPKVMGETVKKFCAPPGTSLNILKKRNGIKN